MKLEECKCLTPTERIALIKSFSFAERYIKDNLRKHNYNKDSTVYKEMNANLIELKDIKSTVENTPECSLWRLSYQLMRHLAKKYRQ